MRDEGGDDLCIQIFEFIEGMGGLVGWVYGGGLGIVYGPDDRALEWGRESESDERFVSKTERRTD